MQLEEMLPTIEEPQPSEGPQNPTASEDEGFLRQHGWTSQLTNFGRELEWTHECLPHGKFLPLHEAVALQVRVLAGTGRWG